ncbi:hypothetical protein M758_UG232300 [Ceratodon purpureus]|nr:hypothetical protein M758_UG232300 [Ceratodon purpureus]
MDSVMKDLRELVSEVEVKVRKLKGIKQKKAHLAEIQVNGGTMAEKVHFGYKVYEKEVPVDAVFRKETVIDINYPKPGVTDTRAWSQDSNNCGLHVGYLHGCLQEEGKSLQMYHNRVLQHIL